MGEVASFINGYAFKPEQWTSFGTPIVRIQNLNNPDAPFNYYNGEVPDKVKIKDGDLLISWSASLGAYIWRGGYAYLNQHIFKVEFDKLNIDKMYLKYAVISNLNTMAGLVHGATMKHIVKKDFDNTCIPVPSLSTQESIVSELDKINELISLKKEQLKDYDNLAQSIFYDMFGDSVLNEKGWEIKKLGEICEFKNGINFSKGESGYRYKFLGVSDFQDNKIVNSNSLSDIHLDENISEEYMLQTGDVVFVRSNGSKELVGRNVLMDIKEPTTFSGFCIRCRLKGKDFNSVYISYLLKIPSMRPIITNSGRGCNISNLNQKILNALPIIAPPLPLQQAFAKRIEAIEQQKQLISSEIKGLETLLASRMQYWFD